MSKEDDQYIDALEKELDSVSRQGPNNSPYSPAMFGGQQKQNLVEWQLDFKPELEAIERTLRNDQLQRDNDGNEVWVPNIDKTKIPLNELGVNDILKKIILLINKNKVLSNYKEDQITSRVKMISHEVRALIYLNYEIYGMDNEYKINCYSSLVIDLDDMIESAYRRALNGEERRDLNQARVVQQNEPMNTGGYPGMQNYSQQSKKFKLWNPATWIG